MKKLIAILSAAVAVCSAVPFTASAAADELTYIPTLYFKGEQSDSIDVLPNGVLYANTKSGKTLKASAKAFIKDDCLRAGQIVVKWVWNDDNVTLSNIQDPISAGTLAPYKGYASASDIGLNDSYDQKMIGVSYQSAEGVNPLAPTGETSDAYPLAVFDVNVSSSAPADYYNIAFKTEQPNVSSISYRLSKEAADRREGDAKGMDIRDIRPSGDNAKPLVVAVSDRMLGDVNDDKTIDAKDASLILKDYALRSANQPSIFTKEQLVAADLNGDIKSDSRDASRVLGYYAYISTDAGNGTSLIDYLYKN